MGYKARRESKSKKKAIKYKLNENDIVSFAVGELGLRLFEFYNMPYCEFILKAQAYHRMQNEQLKRIRFNTFYSMIGSHLDPKKLPKSESNFLPIEEERKSQISDEMRELFKKRQREYEEAIKNYNK